MIVRVKPKEKKPLTRFDNLKVGDAFVVPEVDDRLTPRIKVSSDSYIMFDVLNNSVDLFSCEYLIHKDLVKIEIKSIEIEVYE